MEQEKSLTKGSGYNKEQRQEQEQESTRGLWGRFNEKNYYFRFLKEAH